MEHWAHWACSDVDVSGKFPKTGQVAFIIWLQGINRQYPVAIGVVGGMFLPGSAKQDVVGCTQMPVAESSHS